MPLFNRPRQSLSQPWLFFGRWLIVVIFLFNSLFPQFLGLSFSATPASIPAAQAVSPNLVLSQVYGGGGNSGAYYKNDFIEIFNRGTSPVSLSGYSVQYGSATGDFSTATNLSAVSLAPGQYYLIQEAAGTNTGAAPLSSPDATGAIIMATTAGKVALVFTTTILSCGGTTTACSSDKLATVVDLVGYGATSGTLFNEGGTNNSAPAPSNTTSVVRGTGGCDDSDNNKTDFSLNTVNGTSLIPPRNTGTALSPCGGGGNQPVVPNCAGSLTTGQGVAASKVISATDSDGLVSAASVTTVNPSPASGTISLSSVNPAVSTGGTLTATLTVDAAVPVNDYTVTATFTNTDSPTPQTATCNVSVSVAGATVITPTYVIQGAGHTSPLVNQTVTTEGVITANKSNGFFIQDATGDGDPNTSDGLLVFTGSTLPPAAIIGHLVRVKGTVSEFRSNSRPNDLTVTEISGSPVVTDLGVGPTITPTIISTDPVRTGPNIRKPPAVIDATPGTYNPAANGLDFYESLEGMLVEEDNARVTGPTSNFNDFVIIPDNGIGATGLTPRGGLVIQPPDFNPERVFVDLGVVGAAGIPKVIVGDRIIPPVIGPLDYAFSNFRIQTRSAIPASDVDTTNRVTQQSVAPLTNPNFLRFAIYNIQNFSIYSSDSTVANLTPDPQHVQTIADHIRQNLAAPDLLVVTEVQDSTGKADTGVVTATVSLDALRDRIYIDSSNTISYTYRLIDPVNDQDGGQPGGNIRQVFFFRTDRGLSFVDKPGAGSLTPNTVLPDGSLQYSPGRIDPTNSAFNSSRKPLAGEFMFNGQRLIVVGNHLNSKGGDQALYGVNQPPVLNSEVQRDQQATIIRDFVSQIISATPTANVIVAGDLNDFQFSNPLNILRDKQGALSGNQAFNILVEDPRVSNSPYSYVFEGNAQDLDHILYSQSLVGKVITPTIVHINSEFYNSFSGRGSDHEPETVVFGFPPVCNQPFVVTSQTDNGMGDCGTLSYAINQANQATQPVTITFQTGVMTVTVSGKLPDISGAITRTVTVSGGCASNLPGVNIAGSSGITVGLILKDYVTIDGLKLTGFTGGYGVQIAGSYNHLTCNWLGTANGTAAAANGGGLRIGLSAGPAASNNTLGVDGTPGAGNIIAGNTGVGLQVEKGTNNSSFNTLVGFGSNGASLKNLGGNLRVLTGGQLKMGTGNRF